MSGIKLYEEELEIGCVELLQSLGWSPVEIERHKELREGRLERLVLEGMLRESLQRINPGIDEANLAEVARKVLALEGGDVVERNRQFHTYLREGLKVRQRVGGETLDLTVRLMDFEETSANTYTVVRQYSVRAGQELKIPDVVLFVNGLPLVVIELKNPGSEDATCLSAYHQLQTYKAMIGGLFDYNGLLVASDGHFALAGSLTADYDRFLAWKSVDGLARQEGELETLLRGACSPETLLDLLRNFTVFESTERIAGGVKQVTYAKKVAAYHQYYAVNKALEASLTARRGNKRAGVVWHTQGSGKSLSMLFYVGKIVQLMDNPTVVILTDRNDLDDQLFATFAQGAALLGQVPVQAESRAHLQKLLRTSGGGVVFTTIQKFGEGEGALSTRDNIVVLADEAHRSQYGFKAREGAGKKIVYGFAKYLRDALPNASYLGFTGTPVEQRDRSTLSVFGDYVDIYDIQQAVEDKSTVPIYYESRVVKFEISEAEKAELDAAVEEVLEGVDEEVAEQLKARGLNLARLVGNPDRICKVAQDIIFHFEERQKILHGAGMIVCLNREIAVRTLETILDLRPDWHDPDVNKGRIKLVMSDLPSSDPRYLSWKKYLHDKPARDILARRFKDNTDELELVIVVDMWLTGFDCPNLHTMYLDKIMKAHTLMQAIARVNRVWTNKPGGLVVDYIGVAGQLRRALQTYTDSGGEGAVTVNTEQVLAELETKFTVVNQMFKEYDYRAYYTAPVFGKLEIIRELSELILREREGRRRFLNNLAALEAGIALATPHPRAVELSKPLVIFQNVRTLLRKLTLGNASLDLAQTEHAIAQLVDQSLETGEVVDIFAASGVKRPEIGILSESFLQEMRESTRPNLAIETLKKLLAGEVKARVRTNVVQAKSMSERLDALLTKYNDNLLSSLEMLEELIAFAKEIKQHDTKAQELGLSEYELAFYDALSENESAQEVLGQATLKDLAQELIVQLSAGVALDWYKRSDTQAKVRLMVKRLLRKYGYPPDLQKLAVDQVIEQTKVYIENQPNQR